MPLGRGLDRQRHLQLSELPSSERPGAQASGLSRFGRRIVIVYAGGMPSIRSLTPADVTGADELLGVTFPGSKSLAPRMRRYLAVQPDGWWVAEEEGALVGMVGAVEYGAFAYVGLMGVRPDRQGRGIGRQL